MESIATTSIDSAPCLQRDWRLPFAPNEAGTTNGCRFFSPGRVPPKYDDIPAIMSQTARVEEGARQK